MSSVQPITYKVITETSDNTTVSVIVDNSTFPLASSHGILFQGEAPNAKVGYRYAVTVNQNVIEEPFARPPLNDQETSTLNEFFNRSTNTYQVASLPRAMEPISAIHKIESDLHQDNQIPTIHIHGNKSAVDYLHGQQLEDIEVELSFTYIR